MNRDPNGQARSADERERESKGENCESGCGETDQASEIERENQAEESKVERIARMDWGGWGVGPRMEVEWVKRENEG